MLAIWSDIVVVGIIAGTGANIIKIAADVVLYELGFSKFFCFHVTSGVILAPKWFDTVHVLLIGALTDFIFAGTLGVILSLFLLFIPGRYLLIKGIGFSLAAWLFLCIMVVEKASMWRLLTDPWHAYHSFFIHQLWGVTATVLVLRLSPQLRRKDKSG